MRFPFISRSTYDAVVAEKNERIMELKLRVAKMEEDHERFVDILGGRAIGQTVYGRIIPPSNLGVEEDEEAPAKTDPATDSMSTQLESDMSELGNKARALARRAEGRSRAEIEEAERALSLAQEVGRERAVAGNGQH